MTKTALDPQSGRRGKSLELTVLLTLSACKSVLRHKKDSMLAGPMVQKMYLAIVENSERLEDKGFVGPTVRQMQGEPAKVKQRQLDTIRAKQKQTGAATARQMQIEANVAEEEELVLTQYTILARCPEQYALLALQPITGAQTAIQFAYMQSPKTGPASTSPASHEDLQRKILHMTLFGAVAAACMAGLLTVFSSVDPGCTDGVVRNFG